MAEDFPPLLELMNKFSCFIDKSRVWFNGAEDHNKARMKDNEKKLEELKNIIKFLEEKRNEL